MKIKVEELEVMKEKLLRDFRMLNEQYFAEHPTYSPCLRVVLGQCGNRRLPASMLRAS